MIQVDFGFLSSKIEPEKSVTVLTAIDVRSQLAMGAIVPSKRVTRYALTELKRFVLETGRTDAIIQSDDEASITAITRALCKRCQA